PYILLDVCAGDEIARRRLQEPREVIANLRMLTLNVRLERQLAIEERCPILADQQSIRKIGNPQCVPGRELSRWSGPPFSRRIKQVNGLQRFIDLRVVNDGSDVAVRAW